MDTPQQWGQGVQGLGWKFIQHLGATRGAGALRPVLKGFFGGPSFGEVLVPSGSGIMDKSNPTPTAAPHVLQQLLQEKLSASSGLCTLLSPVLPFVLYLPQAQLLSLK